MTQVSPFFFFMYDHDAPPDHPRLVPAHGPLLVQRSVMEELQKEFRWQWETTSSHRFRMADDMQYSFAYTHFLLEVGKTRGGKNVFLSVILVIIRCDIFCPFQEILSEDYTLYTYIGRDLMI